MKLPGQSRWPSLCNAAILATAVVVSACSGLPSYESTSPPNLSVNVKVARGGPFSISAHGVTNFGVFLHVNAINQACVGTYLGSIKIDSSPVKIGIPPDQLVYLTFEFSGHNFLTRGSGGTSWSSLLTARKGYQYEIDVEYTDDMYSVNMFERSPVNGARRQVGHRSLRTCGVQSKPKG